MFAAWAGAQERPATTVVVARRDLDPGVRLTADDLEARAVELSPELAGATFTGPDQLVGATTLGPLAAGEVVQRGGVRSAGSGSDGPQFSFPVDRERAPGGRRPARGGGRRAGHLRHRC